MSPAGTGPPAPATASTAACSSPSRPGSPTAAAGTPPPPTWPPRPSRSPWPRTSSQARASAPGPRAGRAGNTSPGRHLPAPGYPSARAGRWRRPGGPPAVIPAMNCASMSPLVHGRGGAGRCPGPSARIAARRECVKPSGSACPARPSRGPGDSRQQGKGNAWPEDEDRNLPQRLIARAGPPGAPGTP